MYWLGKYLDPVTLTYILRSSAFYTFYIDVPSLHNYKAYNHQTLHSASPQCTDSAGTLTQWPWPIFCTPLIFKPFTSPFHMSSTIRPSSSKPCIVLLLDVLTRQVPWPGDLDQYFTLMFDISSNISPTHHLTLHSALPHCTGLAGTLTWWAWPIFDTFCVDVR